MTELTGVGTEVTAVLQGLAAGTLIYVVMFEVAIIIIPWVFSPSYSSSFIVALSQS